MTESGSITKAGERNRQPILNCLSCLFFLLYRKTEKMQQVEEEAASTDTSSQSVLSECPFELPRQFSSDSSRVLDCCLIQGHQGRWQNNYKIENHVQVSGD